MLLPPRNAFVVGASRDIIKFNPLQVAAAAEKAKAPIAGET
jgi:hypothetical protein